MPIFWWFVDLPVSPGCRTLGGLDCPGANSHSHRHCQCHLGGIGVLGEDDEQKALISGKSWWKTAEKTLVNLQKLQLSSGWSGIWGQSPSRIPEFWMTSILNWNPTGFSVATLKSHDHPPRSKKTMLVFNGCEAACRSWKWAQIWAPNQPAGSSISRGAPMDWFQIGSKLLQK